MTLGNILVLCGIVAAFIVFALALAWGQFQTGRAASAKASFSRYAGST